MANDWRLDGYLNDSFDAMTYTIRGSEGILAEGLTKVQAESLFYAHESSKPQCDCDEHCSSCECYYCR